MATRDKALEWRGDIRALLTADDRLLAYTRHPEGQPSGGWFVDADKGELKGGVKLPTGAEAAIALGDGVLIAGTDGRLYDAPFGAGEATPRGEALEPAPTALAKLANGRVAALCGPTVVIVDAAGTAVQTLPLSAPGTALAAAGNGRIIAAGTSKGEVAVFAPLGEADDAEWGAGSAEKLHDGAVTALVFEPGDTTFLSAGVDQKLLGCHARGALEAEDRAGRNMHDAPVTAFAWGAEGDKQKLYTCARDGQIKAWTPGRKRPKTWRDGVSRPTAMATLTLRGRPHLAISGEDGTIRVFLLDAEGQVVQAALTVRDAYAAARAAFGKNDASARQKAIDTLAGHDDGPAIELLVDRATRDADAALRVRAVEHLGQSKNPKSLDPLERLLKNDRDAVRMAAFAGLRARYGATERRPLKRALDTNQANIGVAAVEALLALAPADDQAYDLLVSDALNHRAPEVRFAALTAFETHHGDDAVAGLLGLASNHADVRRHALVRFFQRGQLDQTRVASAIRRASADADADVRQTAFHVSLLARPTLAGALRYADRDLHRQLHAIETLGDAKEKKPPKAKKVAADAVSEADRRPLLEAMASRALSTCLAGARGLARLGDGRAFGALLQLSRESEVAIRVDACKALAELGDPRSLGRLRMMLRDPDGSVRDAAFDAVSALLGKKPLEAAEAGMAAPFEDVRRRALRLLVKTAKKKKPKKTDAPAAKLLERALNDAASAVRGEAFKAIVNQQLFGGGDAPLRFTLRSLHAAVRREALNEVMGEIAKPWAMPLLLELFDDPDQSLRSEAFEFARKRAKGRDVTPLARGLESTRTDIRLAATKLLASKGKGAEARALLVKALDDIDGRVRLKAIDALHAAGADDEVVAAMQNANADVRIRAAEERARAGDGRAFDTLLAQAAEERPEVPGLVPNWLDLTGRALDGLSALADPQAVPTLVPLLDADDAELRLKAVRALGWSVAPDAADPLKEALRHADGPVRLAAALALARLGDASGAGIIFAPPPKQTRRRGRRRAATPSVEEQLLRQIFGASGEASDTPRPDPAQAFEAAVALGEREAVQAFVDHPDRKLRRRALRVVLLQAMQARSPVPERLLAALSSAHGRVRLAAADGLARFADPDAFAGFVASELNDRGDHEKAWTIGADVVADMAAVLGDGAPRLRARLVDLMAALDHKEQRVFDHAWGRYSTRFADALAAVRDAERAAAEPVYTADDLNRMAFGAYVGLSRLSGGSAQARIRQTALARLAASGADADALVPVMVPAFGDSHQGVRQQAFTALRTVGYAPSELAAEALACGQRDVGVLGLELLAAEAGDDGDRVLTDVIAGDVTGLADDAARLLATRTSPAHAWTLALDARDGDVRQRAVSHLAQQASDDAAALEGLRGALVSKFAEVRFAAAGRLARRGDAAAFEPLVGALRTDRQRDAISDLVRLGADGTAAALLDRLADDPAGTADASRLLGAVGNLRDTSAIDRLVALLSESNRRSDAFEALRRICGYDQYVPLDLDDDEEIAADDGAWLKDARPRLDAQWGPVLEALTGEGDNRLLNRALDDNTRWAEAGTVDAALAPLAAAKDNRVRDTAVGHLGWRLRHRAGDPTALKGALGYASPDTQFLAAEQLALAGHADGVSILLTAIDMDPSFDHRERAVTALGVLGDTRALDPLLRLVTEDDHALQEVAAEAIGRLAAGDATDRIFAILSKLAANDDELALRALAGLRWFGTVDAWQLIRSRAADDDWSVRQAVAEQLGFHDDPDSRRALAERLVEDDDSDVTEAALTSLRRLHGPDSLEPDYLVVQSHHSWLDDTVVDRLRERGDPARLMAVLPKIREDHDDEFRAPLVAALMALDPAPVDAAAATLAEGDARSRAIAGRLLGRGGTAEAHGAPVEAALSDALAAWQTRRAELDPDEAQYDDRLRHGEEAVRWLLWAAGRLGVGLEAAREALTLSGAGPIRLAAVEVAAGANAVDALADAVTADDPAVRSAAATALARLAPDKAGELAAGAVDDPPSLVPLAADNPAAAAALRAAATRVHAQGVALPLLIARADVDALSAAAGDRDLAEATRLGALEALARIATEAAEEAIVQIAKADDEEENLRRAAWRARRRAARARAGRNGGIR